MVDYRTLLRNVRVLVVDDAEDELELLRVALESCGAVVSAAQSVDEAKRVSCGNSHRSS
jgi:CheY-like chemotaxis protein